MPEIKAADSIKVYYSIDNIWSAIYDFHTYKFWWHKIVKLQIIQPDEKIIGTILKASPLDRKSFSIRVVEIIPLKKLCWTILMGYTVVVDAGKLKTKKDSTILIYEVNLEIFDALTKAISYLMPVSKIHSMIFRKIFVNLEKYLKEMD